MALLVRVPVCHRRFDGLSGRGSSEKLEIGTRTAPGSRSGPTAAGGGHTTVTIGVPSITGNRVFHYDTDFEHISTIASQPHQWVVPAGTID